MSGNDRDGSDVGIIDDGAENSKATNGDDDVTHSTYVDSNGLSVPVTHYVQNHSLKGKHIRTYDPDGFKRRAGCIVFKSRKAVR